jgi:prevent-host-death family protein
MSIVSLKDAKAGLSSYVDDAIRGEFVTITRHGKPVAALVPLQAAEIAKRALKPGRPSFISYLKTFPGGEFERNILPSRDVDL